MKNKFTIMTLGALILSSSISISSSFAQEDTDKNNFASHKTQIIADLKKEASIIGNEISCINSAQDKAAAKKCHEAKMVEMKKIREEKRAKQKAHLQEKIKKLDEQGSQETNHKN